MSKFVQKLKEISRLEEEEQVYTQYREETDPKKIKAILKAEEISKNHEQSILKVLDQQPRQEIKPTPQQKPKHKFIQDDRETIVVTQLKVDNQNRQKEIIRDEKKDRNRDNQRTVNEESKGKNNIDKNGKKFDETLQKEKPTKKQQYRQKQQNNQKKNNRQSRQKQDNKKIYKNEGQHYEKKQYQQKEQHYENKKYEDKIIYHEKQQKGQQSKKYKEKDDKELPAPIKPKKQIQRRNNIDIEIELQNDEGQLQNEIYIGKRDVEIYVQKAKDKLQQFEYIVLKSFAIYVEKAFLVAGLLAKEYTSLKQINIPGTVEVRAYDEHGSKFQKRGSIKIELSLYELNKKHIGYQENNNKSSTDKHSNNAEKKRVYVEKKTEQPKRTYVEKTRSGQDNKKPLYQQRPGKRRSERQRRAPRSPSEQQDLERELR